MIQPSDLRLQIMLVKQVVYHPQNYHFMGGIKSSNMASLVWLYQHYRFENAQCIWLISNCYNMLWKLLLFIAIIIMILIIII